jgi:predicted AlkP superfamily pyrophosphatase or phosphodiesterase
MSRHAPRPALALLLLVLLAPAVLAQQPGRAPKVLLIGLDGVRVDVLVQASTPNIDALAAGGGLSLEAQTRPNTVSGPGWSSMLTGVWMEKHGVEENQFGDNAYDRFPDFLTRIEQVRPELSTLAVLDWPPLGTLEDGGPLISDRIDVKVNVNGDTIGYPDADRRSTEIATFLLMSQPVDAAFVYLGDVDVVGHDTSSLSPEYRAAIETADEQVGRLVAAVRSRPAFAEEDWLILMSTDHGRSDDGDHGEESDQELTIFYLAAYLDGRNVRLQEASRIVDVAVTALAHLRLDIDPAWDLDGRVNGIGPDER